MKKLILLSLCAVNAVTGYAQSTLQNGLVAYYPFNGNADDESGHSYNATNNGATLSQDRFGNRNSAYFFNGSSWITTPLDTISSGKISICAWIKSPGYGSRDHLTIVSSRSGFEMANVLAIFNYDGKYALAHFNGGNPVQHRLKAPSPQILDDKWHFMVCTFDGSSRKIYVDGVLLLETLETFNLKVNKRFIIGNDELPGYNWNFYGFIDDVRIYDRAITQEEINGLKNQNICFQSVEVTNTLVINTVITNYNPVEYQNSIKIFPNPTNDKITIDYGNYTLMSGYRLKIFNSVGLAVYDGAINQSKVELDLSSWLKGLYVVKLFDEKGNALESRKIIYQ